MTLKVNQTEPVRDAFECVDAPAIEVLRGYGDHRLVDLVEKNYRLSPETEADPGGYDLLNNPYWRDVIDVAGHPFTESVTILKSTQVGGTITAQAILIGLSRLDPAPGMLVLPTRDEAVKQRDRIYGNALESHPPFSGMVPPRRFWNTRSIQLGGAETNLAWSGSPQRLRGKPCKRVFLTEVDVYEFDDDAGDPEKNADERTKQFYHKLIFKESTPVGEDSRIYRSWEKSQQRRLHCPCPHCGEFQELRFFPYRKGPLAGRGGVVGIFDAAGNMVDPELAEVSAHYVCIAGCRIEQRFKNLMIKRGVWVADGQTIDKQGFVHGRPQRDSRHVGFHIWTIMQSKISIGKIARAFIEHAGDNQLKEFFQNWLGLRYLAGRKLPGYHAIGAKYVGQHAAGTVPSDVWFLTAGADVQEDMVYWVVVGWAPLRSPYLIDWGEIEKVSGPELYFDSEVQCVDVDNSNIILASDLAQLPEVVLNRTWPVNGTNPYGKDRLSVRLLNCDTNYRTTEVHDLSRTIRSDRFRCIRGDDALRAKEKYRMHTIERNSRTGEPYKNGLHLWLVYKSFYQDAITQRLMAAADQPSVYHWPADILPRGKKFLRQLVNVRKNKKGYYETISGSIGKDNRDILGYAEAAADMVVGQMGWTPAAWLTWREGYLERNKMARERQREQFDDDERPARRRERPPILEREMW